MKGRPFLLLSLLTGISYLACECLSLSTTKGCVPPCTARGDSGTYHVANQPLKNRRSILQGVVLPTLAGLVVTPTSAQALQARNEMLCGTGFFTNIAQYKCTEIGDISQDGKVQSLTPAEEGSMQSLLDKLGLDATTTTEEDDATEGSNEREVSKLNKSQSVPNESAILGQ